MKEPTDVAKSKAPDFRENGIAAKGIVVIAPRHTDYSGLTTGIPRHIGETLEAPPEPKAT